MKNKTPMCSTGHGTGVIQAASLGTMLERQKRRLVAKQGRVAAPQPKRVGGLMTRIRRAWERAESSRRSGAKLAWDRAQ